MNERSYPIPIGSKRLDGSNPGVFINKRAPDNASWITKRSDPIISSSSIDSEHPNGLSYVVKRSYPIIRTLTTGPERLDGTNSRAFIAKRAYSTTPSCDAAFLAVMVLVVFAVVGACVWFKNKRGYRKLSQDHGELDGDIEQNTSRTEKNMTEIDFV